MAEVSKKFTFLAMPLAKFARALCEKRKITKFRLQIIGAAS